MHLRRTKPRAGASHCIVVYPVSFAINLDNPRRLYQDIFNTLLYYELVEVGDLVIFTKGDLDNVAGSTNAMKVLKVKKEE